MSMLGRYFFPSQLVKDAFKGQCTCEWHDTVKCNVRKHMAEWIYSGLAVPTFLMTTVMVFKKKKKTKPHIVVVL